MIKVQLIHFFVAQWTAECGRKNDDKINIHNDGDHDDNNWTHWILITEAQQSHPEERNHSNLHFGGAIILFNWIVVEPSVIQESYREQQKAQKGQQRQLSWQQKRGSMLSLKKGQSQSCRHLQLLFLIQPASALETNPVAKQLARVQQPE